MFLDKVPEKADNPRSDLPMTPARWRCHHNPAVDKLIAVDICQWAAFYPALKLPLGKSFSRHEGGLGCSHARLLRSSQCRNTES